MEFDSFLYSDRTTLFSSSSSPSSSHLPPPSADEPRNSSPRAADVWSYLLSLTQDFIAIPNLQPGKLKHYKLTEFNPAATTPRIGEGACYRVDQHTLYSGGLVAIKRLKIFGGAGEGTRNESVATILKELHVLTHPPIQFHPNIAGLLGYSSELTVSSDGDEDGDGGRGGGGGGGARRQYVEISLVAQFAPYGTLKQFLAKGHGSDGGEIDLLVKAQFMREIASGLEVLHACGIVQGDVKLDNTLVYDDPYVKGGYKVRLSDFGHAIVISEARQKEVRYLGTTILNAPEVRNGSSLFRDVGCEEFYKCDVFSYGLAVWEIILNGARFISTRDTEEDAEVDPLTWLNSLSRDELLRRSLGTLNKTETEESEKALLVEVLRKLLESTLRDMPDDRKTMAEVSQIFRAQKSLREDGNGPTPPYPSDLNMWELPKADGSSLAFPASVQADLVLQLKAATQDSRTSEKLRRNALYDLAMSKLTGFGVTHIDVDAGLDNLVEAALLGSPKALAVVFRLHDAFDRALPVELKATDHPIVRLEMELHLLPPEAYFPERLRRFEKLYQQEALQRRWDVYHGDELLCTNTLLTDVVGILSSRQELKIDLAKLICTWTETPEDECELSITGGLLLHVAARLGLISLVEYISGAEGFGNIVSNDEKPIISASRGGHLSTLGFFLKKDSWATDYSRNISAMHWLMMFSPEDLEAALDKIITSDSGWLGCMNVRSKKLPGMGVHFLNASGSPLEIAIAINNFQLVKLLLPHVSKTSSHMWRGINNSGWGDDAFGLAIRFHHSQLIPVLLSHELHLRRSRPLYKETALVRQAQGKRDLEPFGLFEIGHTPPTISMLVIHGRHSQSALDATLDAIFEAEICSLNDEDEDGQTALTHAVRWAPCDINTAVVSTLVSRGAKFGSAKTPEWIIRSCISGRNDLAEGPIVRLLLERNVLQPTAKLFTSAIQAADAWIVAACLDFGGEYIGANIPIVEEKTAIPPLHIAVMIPGTAQIVNLLLDHGADINASALQRTALEMALAVPFADGEVIDMLVTRGASLESELDTTIVHCAARTRSRVNGVHVLFHLLRHQTVRELVNMGAYGEYQLSPLHMACFTGDIEAVLALLEMEAAIPTREEWDLLRVVEKIGRYPELNPRLPIQPSDEGAVYNWRLTVEKIILLLLDKADPGHGRTPLHVAAQLGNTKRVKQLIEHGGLNPWTGDRDKINALGMLETPEFLKERGADEPYIKNVEHLRTYLSLMIILEVSKTLKDSASLQNVLDGMDPSNEDSVENRIARLELQEKLEDMKLNESHKKGEIIKDGHESPGELEVRYAQRVEELKAELGEDHPDTIEHMSKWSEVITMADRLPEGAELQSKVLEKREATLTDKDPPLYTSWSDRFRLLSHLGKPEEAKVYAFSAVDKALAAFGDKHHVYLTAVYDTALYYWLAGDLDKAIEIHEQLLKTYTELSMRNDLEVLQVHSSLFYIYCMRQKFDEACALVKDIALRLEFVKTEDFLDAFEILIGSVTKVLDQCHLFENSEPIYEQVMKICLRLRGRKAYCTRTVVQRYANHYKERGLWGKEGEKLQVLLDYLRLRVGSEHLDTLKCILDLAQTYHNQARWVEANGLLQQALEGLQRTVGDDHLETLRAKAALSLNWRQQKEFAKAETVGWEAVNGYRRVLGNDDRTIEAERNLAVALSDQDKITETIELREKVLNSVIEVHGEVHEESRKSTEYLATALMKAKRFKEAEVLLHRGINIAVEMHGEQSIVHAYCLALLSNCVGTAGNKKESINLLEKAVSMEKEICGEDNGNTLYYMRQIAKKYMDLGDHEKALEILNKIKNEGTRVYGTEPHNELMYVSSHLGTVYEHRSDFPRAIECFNTTLQMARKLYGDWNEATIAAVYSVFRVQLSLYAAADPQNRQMPEEVYDLGNEAFQYYKKTLGDGDLSTIVAASELAGVCSGLERWQQAEDLHRQVLRGMQISDPENYENDSYFYSTENLIEVLNLQGRFMESEPASRKVVAYRKRTLGDDDEETVYAMHTLSNILLERRKLEQALELNTQIRDICTRKQYSEKLFEATKQLAYIYFKQGLYSEALKLQLEALKEDPENLDEHDFLFRIYMALEKYDDAEATLIKVLTERQRIGPADAETTMDTLSNMVALYMKTKRFQEACRVSEEVVRTRETAAKRRRVIAGDERVLVALMDLKEVYEALGDVEKVLEVAKKIHINREAAKNSRDVHAFRMNYAKHMFTMEMEKKGSGKKNYTNEGGGAAEETSAGGEGSADHHDKGEAGGKGKAKEEEEGEEEPAAEEQKKLRESEQEAEIGASHFLGLKCTIL